MKLKTAHRLLFKARGYHAMYVIGPRERVRWTDQDQYERYCRFLRRIGVGHNGGPVDPLEYMHEAWPLRLGTTGDTSEALVHQGDGWNPVWTVNLLARIWCDGPEQSHFLLNDVRRHFGDTSMRKQWVDGGRPLDRDMLDQNIKWIAADNGMRGLTDLELLEELEAVHQRTMSKRARGRDTYAA